MIANNINRYSLPTQYNSRQEVSFSGNKSEFAKKAGTFLKNNSVHFIRQGSMQIIAPFLMDSFESPQRIIIVKLVTDIGEAISEIRETHDIKLSENCTNIIAIGKSAIIAVKKAIKR